MRDDNRCCGSLFNTIWYGIVWLININGIKLHGTFGQWFVGYLNHSSWWFTSAFQCFWRLIFVINCQNMLIYSGAFGQQKWAFFFYKNTNSKIQKIKMNGSPWISCKTSWMFVVMRRKTFETSFYPILIDCLPTAFWFFCLFALSICQYSCINIVY